jgi:hypothetical protein
VIGFTPRPLYPWEESRGTHWIGGWVDPRVGLDDMEKIKFLILPGLELRPLRRPARSQSLYRLRYPGSSRSINKYICICINEGGAQVICNTRKLHYQRTYISEIQFSHCISLSWSYHNQTHVSVKNISVQLLLASSEFSLPS